MENSEIPLLLKKLKELAAKQLKIEVEKIDDDAKFDELGLDSLALADFVFEVEDEFAIDFSLDRPDAIATLRELAESIAKNQISRTA